METEIKTFWYIGLEQEGSTLFYSEQNRNWSIWRSEASGWLTKDVAEARLRGNIERNNVPRNAKVVGVRLTTEEIK